MTDFTDKLDALEEASISHDRANFDNVYSRSTRYNEARAAVVALWTAQEARIAEINAAWATAIDTADQYHAEKIEQRARAEAAEREWDEAKQAHQSYHLATLKIEAELRAELARVREAQLPVTWESCCFYGPAPDGFISWYQWANARIYRHVCVYRDDYAPPPVAALKGDV